MELYRPLFGPCDGEPLTLILRDLSEGDREDVLYEIVSEPKLVEYLPVAVTSILSKTPDVSRAVSFVVDAWQDRGSPFTGHEEEWFTVREQLLRLIPLIGEGADTRGASSPYYRSRLLDQFGIEF